MPLTIILLGATGIALLLLVVYRLVEHVKEPWRPLYFATISGLMICSLATGLGIGIYKGQQSLLETRRAYYTSEVVKTQISRFGISGIPSIDTVYNATSNEHPVAYPITNPEFYTTKRDTLWTTAIFCYKTR